MTPEASAHLAKAEISLRKARSLLTLPSLRDNAARIAYRAGSHSAQALIFERMGQIAKTNRGLRTLFAELVDQDCRLNRTLTRFLGKGHQFEQLVDCEVTSRAPLTEAEAQEVIDFAKGFIDRVAHILAQPSMGTPS